MRSCLTPGAPSEKHLRLASRFSLESLAPGSDPVAKAQTHPFLHGKYQGPKFADAAGFLFLSPKGKMLLLKRSGGDWAGRWASGVSSPRLKKNECRGAYFVSFSLWPRFQIR